MYVVTGGAGFIGSNIVWSLEQRGLGPVVVADRLGTGEKWRNIAKREIADLVPPGRLMEFLDTNAASVSAVIHMGAISATTERDADLIFENNFALSMDLWRWCAAREVRFIYASSAATYGDGAEGFDDDATPGGLARLRPMNAYGWSKHLFDRRIVRIVENGEPRPPQWAGLKFFNVFGPNEYHKDRMKSVVAQIQPVAACGETCRLFRSHRPDYEDGGQLRDFVWVDDCVKIVDWLLDNEGVSGIFNAGTGHARSFLDLATAVYRALDREPQIEYTDTPEDIRDRYQYFTQANMGKLRTAGFDAPMTSLEDAVRSYVVDFLSADDPYR